MRKKKAKLVYIGPDEDGCFMYGDLLYPVQGSRNSYTSDKMKTFFGNDAGLHISDIGETVDIEIWNSPLYQALK